jgi:hypothetical protein
MEHTNEYDKDQQRQHPRTRPKVVRGGGQEHNAEECHAEADEEVAYDADVVTPGSFLLEHTQPSEDRDANQDDSGGDKEITYGRVSCDASRAYGNTYRRLA